MTDYRALITIEITTDDELPKVIQQGIEDELASILPGIAYNIIGAFTHTEFGIDVIVDILPALEESESGSEELRRSHG